LHGIDIKSLFPYLGATLNSYHISMNSKTVQQHGRTGFMQFSKKVDYGLFLLLTLLKGTGGITSLRRIADENHISFYFLQKIALQLREAGLIKSERGKLGGYRLKRPPEKITVKDVIEALEGPIAVTQCLPQSGCRQRCSRENFCSARYGLQYVNEKIINSLNEITLINFIK
jgi:Rrf2 family protein